MEKLWENITEFFTTASADLVLKIIGAGAMLFFGFKLIRFGMKLVEKSLKKSRLDEGIQGFIENLLSITLRFMLVISVLMYLGVPAASFIAILTSAGLAIGLALQGSLSNFAGGLMILFFKPFRVNDFIRTDSADGVVQNISIMYTTLKTLDGKKVVIPNAMLSNSIVTDFTWHDTRRVDVSFTTDFTQDVTAITDMLKSLAQSNGKVLPDPAPDAFLERIQDGMLVISLRCWVKTPDWWPTNLQLTADVKRQLEAMSVPLRGQVREIRQI